MIRKMIFKCVSCDKWKFFENKYEGICSLCDDLRKDSEYYFVMKEREKSKKERRIARETELNEKLKIELKRELKGELSAKIENKDKIQGNIVKNDLKSKLKDELNGEVKSESKKRVVSIEKTKVEKVSLLMEAEKLSWSFDSVLYVYADVKRVKVIEWINGKKRVALNKEREVRHTHKGGFSQEKFQRFVDTKKRRWLEWVEEVISRQGVLRESYGKIVCEGVNEEFIRRLIQNVQ